MPSLPSAGKAVMFTYMGLSAGGLASAVVSQALKSRKKALAIFMVLNMAFMLMYFFANGAALVFFYLICGLLGFASGYWALFVTVAAEQFGTNIRATVATTVPNFVRGSVVILTLAFEALRPHYGIINAGLIESVICVILSFWALSNLKETHAKDLDYIE